MLTTCWGPFAGSRRLTADKRLELILTGCSIMTGFQPDDTLNFGVLPRLGAWPYPKGRDF